MIAAQLCDAISLVRASTAAYEPSPGSMRSQLSPENIGKRNISQDATLFKAVLQARTKSLFLNKPYLAFLLR
ncbi:hypothetical protein SV7mr_05340 [Stieleria bergensis]|uniref:Uncharacterized protein n=1 Tax=Stieleria bergensis TaxID=2528025 RepID=A0A517SPI9_9BACT|nr:hypothetical protein SV7mr_05340 [Planctomycetes bacterium SV_7m_r]